MKLLLPSASGSLAIRACALAFMVSIVGCGLSNSGNPPPPTISPGSGTFTTVPTVNIFDTEPGTTIYYTTDGSAPTTSSTLYGGPVSGPFAVTQTETIRAIAVGALGFSETGLGYNQSAIATATITINLSPAPTPTITPAGGTYSQSQSVAISDSLAGTSIYYTTDGSMPTVSSTPYTGPFTLFANANVQAIADGPFTVGSGNGVSSTASASFVIQAATPAISPAAGTYTSAQTVTISDTTPGAAIHYTLDGSAPTTSSPTYNGPITVAQTETLNAIAASSKNANSPIAAAAYVINYPAATPVISPAAGTYTSVQTVTITDTTPGAAIYYTIDNTTPTTSSSVYSGPITVPQTETIKAIASALNYSVSAVASSAYTLNFPTTPAPNFTPAPASGTIYSTPQTVTITDSLAGATIHYTTNSTTPTITSPVYSGPITVSSNETISAIATAGGYNPSSVVTYGYYISATSSTLSGTVQSGAVNIYNATVNLYAAGTTGYGTGAILLATTMTDISGRFQFTQYANGIPSNGAVWSCPSTDPNPDPQIYITAVGGNTQGTGTTSTNNSAAGFMVAIGPCSKVSTLTDVMMNEEVTVATVFALAQYINPGNVAGAVMVGTNGANTSSSTPQGAVGLNNAVAGIANLANIATGAAVTSTTHKGTNANVTSVTVTATPETAKLVTIADTLGACINSSSSSSSQCTDLFASANPPPSALVTSQPSASFATAQDTIQAAYFMAVNPTDAGTYSCTTSAATTKLGCLFNLASTNPTYPSGLTAVPTDWTVSVSYSAYTTGTGISTASGAPISPYTCADGHYFLYGPQRSAVDAYGNLWFVNGIQHTSNIAAISPIGVPIFCAVAINPQSPFGDDITIDTAGNIWANYTTTSALATTTNQIFEVPSPGAIPTATAMTGYTSAQLGSTTQQTTGIVADAYGNVFYTTVAPTGGMSVYEIPAGTTAASSPASYLIGSAIVGATGASIYGASDSVGRVYLDSNSGSAEVVEVTPPSANISGYTITGGTITFTTVNSPTFTAGQSVLVSGLTSAGGLLLDRQHLSVIAVTSTSFSAVTSLNATSGNVPDIGIAVAVPTSPASYALVTNTVGTSTYGAAVDNNNFFYSGATCCGAAPEEELLKLAISPAGSSIVLATGNYSWSPQNIGGLTGTRSVVLDGAGNVWFGNDYASSDGAVVENSDTGIWSIGEASTAGGGSTATFTPLSPAATGLVAGDSCVSAAANELSSGDQVNPANNHTGCTVGGGFQKTSLGLTTGLAIDPSGNVWAPNFTNPGSVGTGYGNPNIVEIIGAAVPVVTPLSVGAANGTLATKP